MKNWKNNKKSGYALLELLFYISFFVILSLVVINAMISMSKSFKETAIQAGLMQGGTIMETIERDIRQAKSISSISSNDLVINTTDASGASETLEFALSGTDLRLLQNGAFVGNLNTPNILISSLNFVSITTAKSSAVKISFTVQSTNDTYGRSVEFDDTAVLRGSY